MPSLDLRIPFVPLTWQPNEVIGEDAVRVVDDAAAVNGLILGVNSAAITPSLVQTAHTSNMLLMAWTVDAEDDMRAMVDMGLDAISSNRLDALLNVLSDTGCRPG